MSVNSVNQYTYGMTLADLYFKSSNETSETEEQSSLSTSSLSTKNAYANLKAYGSMQSSEGLAAIKQAISEINPDGNGRVTFKMIQEHRAGLEEDFGKAMRAAATLAGVDEKTEFKIIANKDGEIEVQCEDPASKQIIEAVLKEIPALGEEFKYIQALGNVEKAQNSATASTHRLSLEAARAGLQQEAMEVFMAEIFSSGTVGYGSLLADFGSESTDYFMGANYFV